MSSPSLLNRSNYSFLNSSLTIEEIVSFAVSKGHTHVVISDFENSYAWTKFYREATKHDIIPVFGIQINYKNSSLLFLAKNKQGYIELLSLSKSKEVENMRFGDLVFIHLDGEDHFPNISKYVANVEGDMGVYIRENKFLKASDFDFFCLLRAIDNGTKFSEELELNRQFSEDYLEFEEEEPNLGSKQIKNIYAILEMCEKYDILENNKTLFFYQNPEVDIRALLKDAMTKIRFSDSLNKDRYQGRIDQELEVIISKGFCEYFLIVHDIVRWAKQNSIYIGPGRGSVCGSLVAYVLGITEIDPIKYELYFERFLNPTRVDIPDIDIDVANNKREELFEYIRGKYGEDNVALIGIYRTFKTKNSIRDICKAFDVPISEVESCLVGLEGEDKLNFENLSLSKLVNNHPYIKSHLVKIQDYPCNLSIHAAGIVISSLPLSKYIPLVKTPSSPLYVTQWEAEEIKDLGFIKFDFLALQYLQILNNMERRVGKSKDSPINWDHIDLDDPNVYETIVKGRNIFIFQFESPKIKSLIRNFQPASLLDLALVSSIHRPGASDQIPTLLARKSFYHLEELKPDKHEGLVVTSKSANSMFESILKDTYGLLVYQEQLMKLISAVTGCSFGKADEFRRALGSPTFKEELVRKWFFGHGLKKFSKEELEPLWDSISRFAKYGFNKSHAVAYAIISYRLIWIKTYYPEIFYSEVMSFSINKNCFYELEEIGYSVSLPTYGKSDYSLFKAIDKNFYFPISHIQGISIPEEKYLKITGKKESALEAIQELIEIGISVPNIKLLIRAGYFNNLFEKQEPELYWEKNLQAIYDHTMYKKSNESIFDLELKPVKYGSEDLKRYREYRKNILGFDFANPRIGEKVFARYKSLKRLNTIYSQKNNTCKYIGFISQIKESKTFKDTPFLFLKLSDGFYTTPNIPYFWKEPDLATLQAACDDKSPVIFDIEKTGDYFKIVKIRIVS